MYFHHIGYLVKNIGKSMDAFSYLGYEIEKEPKHDELRCAEIAFMKRDMHRIELIQPDGRDSLLYPLLRHYKNTPYHSCYIIEDMDKAMEALRENGFMVFKMPEEASCMDNKRVAFLMHPDIGIIELCEDVGGGK